MKLFRSIKRLFTISKAISLSMPDDVGRRDPVELFGQWYSEAEKAGILMPEAMSLTTSLDNRPSSRMVLMKSFDASGLVFFTNYHSRKADELDKNPHAALLFYWPVLQRQVRIEGTVERITTEESIAYFDTRPRGSQIGAWASKQSSLLSSRAELENAVKKIEHRFKNQDVVLPDFWGGYRVKPESIEFWQGRTNRLHDRLCFKTSETGWKSFRLYP